MWGGLHHPKAGCALLWGVDSSCWGWCHSAGGGVPPPPPPSVGFGDVPVHVEVAGDLGEDEVSPLQLRCQQDLAAQAGILLQQRGLVQQVVFPGGGGTDTQTRGGRLWGGPPGPWEGE